MALPPPPVPPQTSVKRVKPDLTATQSQIDYERALTTWTAGLSSGGGGGGGGTIPLPTPTTLGGVKSASAPSHQFQTGINGSGSPTFAQPNVSDVTGLGALATLSTLTSALISDATTAGKALLIAATVAAQKIALGLSAIATSGSINDIAEGTTGAGAVARSAGPTFTGTIIAENAAFSGTVSGLATVATSGSASDLGTGTLPAGRLPNPSASTLGGVQSKAAVASNWLTSISTSGVPAASQPDFSDISGAVSPSQLNGMSKITNAIAADVALTNASYTVGPTIAQGTSGTWFASGTITCVDTTASANFIAVLWDGTTAIDSTIATTLAANAYANLAVSGYITNPAGNIRISALNLTRAAGAMKANATGWSFDSKVSAIRIG
jgi:hypothetical protein